MDRETLKLIQWAENYNPAVNSIELNEFIHIPDLGKCISVLIERVKSVDKTPSFVAYKDKLKMIKNFVEKE